MTHEDKLMNSNAVFVRSGKGEGETACDALSKDAHGHDHEAALRRVSAQLYFRCECFHAPFLIEFLFYLHSAGNSCNFALDVVLGKVWLALQRRFWISWYFYKFEVFFWTNGVY